MALRKKLDADDIAVLEIVEDPVWFPEFLRNTADGDPDVNTHPMDIWEHRDYQKMILTDKSKYVSVLGGRAIGKCQPGNMRALVVGEGYQRLDVLAQRPSFATYALTDTGELVQRRARAITDKVKQIYIITTHTGHVIKVTGNHPFLTEQGWAEAKDLTLGDRVAITTLLPHETPQNTMRWHELRWLGYTYLAVPTVRLGVKFKPRYKRIAREIEIIAERFSTNLLKDTEGNVRLNRPVGPLASPVTALITEMGIQDYIEWNKTPAHLPKPLMRECNDNTKIFLEALFAQYGTVTPRTISLDVPSIKLANDIQELLLRHNIETRITRHDGKNATISALDYENVYNFYNTFSIPGVGVGDLPAPTQKAKTTAFMRFDAVTNIELQFKRAQTYAVYVYDDNNYISENFIVHNTVIIEDKLIYEHINVDIEFPQTRQQVLTTANLAQMTPLMKSITQRFTASKFLSAFLDDNINKQEGTLTFPQPSGKPFTFFFRIAGSKGEQNVVGLHLPKIKIDEAQIYPPRTFIQLLPTLNHWERNTQIFVGGVPNGLRSSVLYITDKLDPKYKKYRIPSHNNPYYDRETDNQNLREFGGELDDRYQQLVLGRHGAAALQLIAREDMKTETFQFLNYRYTGAQKLSGIGFADILQRPKIPNHTSLVLAVDPGYTDNTVMNLVGLDTSGRWRTYVRYTLSRIDFYEQTVIIDHFATHYNIGTVSIDISAGGNGASIMHNLLNDDKYRHKNYKDRVKGIQFSEKLSMGFDANGDELSKEAKNYGVEILVRMIQEQELIFSEHDHDGINQLERMAKQKTINGRDTYFILSKSGNGADKDDHIFAAYICFALALDSGVNTQKTTKIAKPTSMYTSQNNKEFR